MDYKKSLHELLSLEEFLQDDSDQTDEGIKAELLEDGIDANLALEAFKKKVEDAYLKELEKERNNNLSNTKRVCEALNGEITRNSESGSAKG